MNRDMTSTFALEGITHRRRALLVQHGLWIIFFGLIGGVGFAFSILGYIELWPVLPRVEWLIPGSEKAWLRAHTGPITNGLLALALAGIGGYLRLTEMQQKVLTACMLFTLWGNTFGYFNAAITGGRGTAFGGSLANSLTYLAFASAVVTVFVVVVLALVGVRNHRRLG